MELKKKKERHCFLCNFCHPKISNLKVIASCPVLKKNTSAPVPFSFQFSTVSRFRKVSQSTWKINSGSMFSFHMRDYKTYRTPKSAGVPDASVFEIWKPYWMSWPLIFKTWKNPWFLPRFPTYHVVHPMRFFFQFQFPPHQSRRGAQVHSTNLSALPLEAEDDCSRQQSCGVAAEPHTPIASQQGFTASV